MTESVVQYPLFDEVASELKFKGIYQKQLSAEELAEIMKGVVKGLLANQSQVRASVPTMDVSIANMQGTIKGVARIEAPIQAEIGVNCVLGNSKVTGQRLSLEGFKYTQKAGFTAGLALGALKVEAQARKVLVNPDSALYLALKSQLDPRRAEITEMNFGFTDKATFAIDLRGKAKA